MRFRTQILATLVVLAETWRLSCPTLAQTTSTVRVASGLNRPVAAVSAPDDPDRLFIAEQFVGSTETGRISILDLNSNTVTDTFIELPNLENGNGNPFGGSEQGLLGLTFDPDYLTNGYFYVNVTTTAGNGDTHVRRYQATGTPATATSASIGTETEIISFNQPQGNHNGGWIGFSPNDGNLYIASGDGGGSFDNGTGHTAGTGNSQDITNNLLGKMLRIDVGNDDFPGDVNRNYAIPGDNPFVDVTGDDEIWAYGLRNPFRNSFDRDTGDLWIGDVGQGRREEIDFQPASSLGGENYGWRLREGIIATPLAGIGGPRPEGNVDPIYDYDHLAQFEPDPDYRGNVVIGGYVYRGPIAELQGLYLFADAGSNNIWSLDPDAVVPRESVQQINDRLLPDEGSISGISSFGEDAVGNLYITDLTGGEVFRITSSSRDIVWNGDDSGAGTAGDGVSWGDEDNWTRDGTPDQAFVSGDNVLFGPGSSQSTINLQANRTVAAASFDAAYTLQGNMLQVLSGNVTVADGVTATIASTLAADTENHSIRKLGSGTLFVEGNSGQVSVKEGTLGGTGTLDNLIVRTGATVAPGTSVGTLQVAGAYTMESGALLSLEIGGTETGEYDLLSVDGIAQLDGALEVEFVNLGGGTYQPMPGDNIPFLTATGGAGGTLDLSGLPTLGTHLEWVLNPGGVTVSLLVNSTLEADFNNDGSVDDMDLGLWEEGFGTIGSAGRFDGDANGDMSVTGADLLIWQQQKGLTAGALAASTRVPEPTGAALLLAAVSTIALRRGATRLSPV